MKKELPQDVIAALDIGTTHTTLVVASTSGSATETSNKNLAPSTNILGFARSNSSGTRKGSIVNFEKTTASILDVIDEVEHQTGLTIGNVRISVSGINASCDNFTQQLLLRSDEVRAADVNRLLADAMEHRPPPGTDYIQVMPVQFLLDERGGIEQPVGMVGTQLGAIFHRVAFPQNDLRNIVKACNSAGLRVDAAIFAPLAAAEAVLHPDEKDLGIICIDLGSELTHVAVYFGGYPIYCKDFPLGSHHVTKDLAIGLRTTQAEAERIKREHGQAFYTPTGASEPLPLLSPETSDRRTITRGETWNIIEPRIAEILETIRTTIDVQCAKSQQAKGLVITGGGALLNGLCLVAEDAFGKHARIGCPTCISGVTEGLRSPVMATAVGLLSSKLIRSHTAAKGTRRISQAASSFDLTQAAKSVWNKVMEPFQ